jgi:hypothetical protein
VTITCDPITLFKGNAWYRVPARCAHFVITVGEPIPVADFLGQGEPPSLAARHLTKALTDWFDVSVTQQLHEMRRETRLKG